MNQPQPASSSHDAAATATLDRYHDDKESHKHHFASSIIVVSDDDDDDFMQDEDVPIVPAPSIAGLDPTSHPPGSSNQTNERQVEPSNQTNHHHSSTTISVDCVSLPPLPSTVAVGSGSQIRVKLNTAAMIQMQDEEENSTEQFHSSPSNRLIQSIHLSSLSRLKLKSNRNEVSAAASSAASSAGPIRTDDKEIENQPSTKINQEWKQRKIIHSLISGSENEDAADSDKKGVKNTKQEANEEETEDEEEESPAEKAERLRREAQDAADLRYSNALQKIINQKRKSKRVQWTPNGRFTMDGSEPKRSSRHSRGRN